MDVTGISVSIDVDMSGFIEAMEKITAMLLTVDEEMLKSAEAIRELFESVQQSSDKAGVSLDDVLGLLVDVVATCKDLLEIDAGDPIAILTLIADVTKLGLDVKKTYEDANKAMANTSGNAKILKQNVDAGTKGGSAGATQGTPDNKTSFTIAGSQNYTNSDVTTNLDTLFESDYTKNLAMVQKLMSGTNALIKVNASALSFTDSQFVTLNQNAEKTTGAITKVGEAAKKMAWQIKMAMDAAAGSITTAFEAMGKAAAGQKTNVLEDEAKQLGAFAEKMGAKYISMGVALEVASGGASPKGWLEIAGGGLLAAAGAAMKSIKMASGGIVSGSSFVNVGEYAGASHNPEVIAPLDKLKGMMGGQHQTHSFEIQGDKLVSILQRVDNNNSFALGGA